MGKTIKYYLISRDRNTNEFAIVYINGQRSTSLEDIDLYTMDSSNSTDLSKRINKDGDYDYYIVNQIKKGNSIFINTNEVIYSNSSNLRDIAINSKDKKLGRSADDITAIFKKYCRSMAYDNDYFRLNVNGRTNIYNKLIRYFMISRYQVEESIQNKDGNWARKSYTLIRNIVESFINGRRDYKHISDENYRELLNEELIRETDSTFDPNQINMFDLFPDQKPKDTSKEKFEVIKTFESIPFDVVKDDEFRSTLPHEVRSIVKSIVELKTYYELKAYTYEDDYYKGIREQYHNLLKLLDDESILSNSIKWCKVYNDSNDKSIGDVNGYSYTKGNKQ